MVMFEGSFLKWRRDFARGEEAANGAVVAVSLF
jgi:hypothetical protein